MAAALTRERQLLRAALEIVLRPYGQIILSRDLGSGALVAAAVALFPRLALATLLAIAVAAVTAAGLGLGARAAREGVHGCAAVLTTLATAVFAPGGGHPVALVVLGAVLAVALVAAFDAIFAAVALPSHSLPFVGASWLVHLAARSLPGTEAAPDWLRPLSILPEALVAPSPLDVPAAILFLHGGLAAGLVLAAIALHSRIALLLGAAGTLTALALHEVLRPAMTWSAIDTIASFNALLTAMALGGVWFVPQPSALLLAMAGAAVSVLVSYALSPLLGTFYLPLLSLPFALTVHLTLLAARRRVADRRPRSAPAAARPEEALARHLTRLRRFGDAAWLPFRLPFRGAWVVTQGYGGMPTHQGPWRHGLDFEAGPPRTHPDRAPTLRDYPSYNLPVLVAGGGTVVEIVDGIEDNEPGQVAPHDPWGNAVVVAHGPALYSVYAHLKPRSITVRVGESLQAGREIARCGSSGRSPVPHLHFQLQATPALGSPTLPGDFGDVVCAGEGGEVLHSLMVPPEGAHVRPVLRDESLARALAFAPGSTFVLEDADGAREPARVELDLAGRRLLRSERAALQLERYDAGFVVVDFEGDPRSLLRFVLIALGRVPFDQAAELRWTDSLPRRLLLPAWLRSLADLVAVVLPRRDSARVAFHAERHGGELRVVGTHPEWSSEATLSLDGGVHRIVVRHGALTHAVTLRALAARAVDDGSPLPERVAATVPAGGGAA
ncbi:MAG: urea transporter [Polyangiaceae bacterium]|nr:urea transporter [Polyangiaceae bacterium]